MLTSKERNDFLAENYVTLSSVISQIVRVIHRKFPRLHLADLNGYAWLGVVRALENIDITKPTWLSFLKRYAFGYTVSGALQMQDVYRSRSTTDESGYLPGLMASADIGDFEQIMEVAQVDEAASGRGMFDKLFTLDERIWFTRLIEGSVEHAILVRLFLGESLVEISEKHNIKIRSLRRFMSQLKFVHDEAVKGNPVQHLLTPLRDDSGKYATLAVTDDMIQRLHDCYSEEFGHFRSLDE